MDGLRIKEAASKVGLSLTDDQLESLSRGEPVQLRGCNGIKIVDLGGGCALYWNPPFGVSVCCKH
jgi:hypothetical protein